MFPKFVIIFTKSVPATPTSLAQNTVLEYRVADDEANADSIKLERLGALRTANIGSAQFGEGAPTVQDAIYPLPAAAAKA